MTVRNLPLVGFQGLDANLGPVRYREFTKEDFPDQAVFEFRQGVWDILRLRHLPNNLQLPESVRDLNAQSLRESLDGYTIFNQEQKQAYLDLLTGDLDHGRRRLSKDSNNVSKKLRKRFETRAVIMHLFPIVNIISGIQKIIIGIADNGEGYGVIEEDRGWKFKATLIGVGIAEICFLGLIVHGIATFYFAITSPKTHSAQA